MIHNAWHFQFKVGFCVYVVWLSFVLALLTLNKALAQKFATEVVQLNDYEFWNPVNIGVCFLKVK